MITRVFSSLNIRFRIFGRKTSKEQLCKSAERRENNAEVLRCNREELKVLDLKEHQRWTLRSGKEKSSRDEPSKNAE